MKLLNAIITHAKVHLQTHKQKYTYKSYGIGELQIIFAKISRLSIIVQPENPIVTIFSIHYRTMCK